MSWRPHARERVSRDASYRFWIAKNHAGLGTFRNGRKTHNEDQRGKECLNLLDNWWAMKERSKQQGRESPTHSILAEYTHTCSLEAILWRRAKGFFFLLSLFFIITNFARFTAFEEVQSGNRNENFAPVGPSRRSPDFCNSGRIFFCFIATYTPSR